jgi:hypothetical protein
LFLHVKDTTTSRTQSIYTDTRILEVNSKLAVYYNLLCSFMYNKLFRIYISIQLVRTCLNIHCDMLYMHNVTLTKDVQKKKIGQLLEAVLTPPMEGGVSTTSRSCQ